jgi:hypothetical protein
MHAPAEMPEVYGDLKFSQWWRRPCEYIWLDDMPVAVVDNVQSSPAIYYVQVDHLQRPARMTCRALKKRRGASEGDHFCAVRAPFFFEHDKEIFGEDSNQALLNVFDWWPCGL